MASFSYSSFLPNEFVPNFNNFYSPFENQQGSSFETSCIEQQSIYNNETSTTTTTTNTLSEKQAMPDKIENGDHLTQNCVHVDKKRKSRNGSSLNSANSKDANKQEKSKKQKEEKESKDEKKGQNKATEKEEAPKDYIHVRARRGQATDSHSLAERVRREKIGEKMRTLQSIVPGCDKVTGKALMLDEIINYVQSLQNQVEFLSMKLASVDPMVYTLGLMDLDPMVFGADVQLHGMNDNNNTGFPIPLVQSIINGNTSGSSTPSQSFATANSCLSSPATSSTLINPIQFDSSTNNLILHEQKPNMPQFQDVGSSYYGVNEQERETIMNQFGFSGNKLYSIQ